MLAWSEESITDVRKPEIMVMTSIGGELFTDYSRSPRKSLSRFKPKTQINRRRTLPAFSCWWDAYRKQLGLKDFSPKSQDAVALQQIKERGALPMIDRRYSSGNRPLQQYLACRALVMVSSSIRLTA